ncbi:MAG: PucR family transcriptional regulator [Actinobacteria bacterium]|nr:PucR family transcriptional regulator [Actinomycetota bacterium]
MTDMTVAAALDLPVLRRGLPEVVAGGGSLDRQIRWVHAGEAPDIASLLRGGELLLTTGMGIAKPSSQRRFVAELAAGEVAGLVVELGGAFADKLPATLVDAARHHGLPLVELRTKVRFVAVTEAIHTEIVNGDYERLRRADELRRDFTQAMLTGEGIQGVLRLLAEALGNPVFLENHHGRLLAYAGPGEADDDEPVAVWLDARERAGTAAAVQTGVREGRLLALPLEGPLDAFSLLAVERAAEIVALAMLRSRQEIELLALGRGDLIVKLAERQIAPAIAAGRAADMGFRPRNLAGLLPLAARLTTPSGPAEGPRFDTEGPSWVGSLADLERELATLGIPILVGVSPVDGDLLILAGLCNGFETATIADRVATVLRRAARRRAGAEVVVAVGSAGDWPAIGDGLRDAIETVAVAREEGDAVWHDAKALSLERLLWRLAHNRELKDYVARVLGPLLTHDAARTHKLLPTLEALCANGARKAITARSLNLNRQALYGRIGRIETVLGVDLSDPETLASIDLALRARRHVDAGC